MFFLNFLYVFYCYFIISPLADLRPNLDHRREGSPSHLMVITAQLSYATYRLQETSQRGWVAKTGLVHPVRFKSRTRQWRAIPLLFEYRNLFFTKF